MNVFRTLIPTVALILAFGVSDAFAQTQVDRPDQAPTALAAGTHSLSFGVPGGGNPYAPGTLGYWIMVTPEMNLGINVGLALDRIGEEDTITQWDLLIAPAIKMYTTRLETVAPYYFGQLNIRMFDDGIERPEGVDDPDSFELGLALGFGAEWFPVPNFSIGGHVGLGVDIIRLGEGQPVALGTFTSGLSAQIYF